MELREERNQNQYGKNHGLFLWIYFDRYMIYVPDMVFYIFLFGGVGVVFLVEARIRQGDNSQPQHWTQRQTYSTYCTRQPQPSLSSPDRPACRADCPYSLQSGRWNMFGFINWNLSSWWMPGCSLCLASTVGAADCAARTQSGGGCVGSFSCAKSTKGRGEWGGVDNGGAKSDF